MPNLQVKTLFLRSSAAALLLACAEPVEPDAALPTDAAPPPFNLTLGPAPVPGGTISATLSGAPAGATWALIAANGGIAMDQGLCPPVLAGGCMDILDGTLGYRLVGSGTVPAGGSVAWSATLPGTIQPGAYQLQAVLTAPQPAESNPVEFTIGSSCPDARRAQRRRHSRLAAHRRHHRPRRLPVGRRLVHARRPPQHRALGDRQPPARRRRRRPGAA
jgi:hypothetical protein